MEKNLFWKFFVEGNSYVIIDSIDFLPKILRRGNDVHLGLGGDGILLAEWKQEGVIGMRVFNLDGSEAPMCGNGARCIAALAVKRNPSLREQKIIVHATGGTVEHKVLDETSLTIEGTMKLQENPILEQKQDKKCYLMKVGSPHLVVFEDLLKVSVHKDGPVYERSVPGGTNVMFTSVESPGVIRILPWERGVGAVKGCASGAAAAVIAASNKHKDWPEYSTVFLPGGTIKVKWSPQKNVISFTGTAELVAEGYIFA